MGSLRTNLYRAVRFLGGFALARRITRRQLRILCYHGFSVADEHDVAPYMFMRPETFERRLRILQKLRVPVISLDEAVAKLGKGEIAHAETVITLDDAWATSLTIGAPILRKYGYPACIYVTTDHLDAGTEAFNVAVAYMVHRSPKASVMLRKVHPLLDGDYQIAADPQAAATAIINAAASVRSLTERQQLLPPLAKALGLDYRDVMKQDRFRLLNGTQVKAIAALGVSIQLHTHSHVLPDDTFDAMANEIELNRSAIKELVGVEPQHFCYPSGMYSPWHPEWLSRLGIESATTCDPGLNGPDARPLLLKRYPDSELASDIEFEAEVAGVRELLRNIRTALSSLVS